LRLKNSYVVTIGVMLFVCLCPQQVWMKALYKLWSPTVAYCLDDAAYGRTTHTDSWLTSWAGAQIPIYEYSVSYYGNGILQENYQEYAQIMMQENRQEESEQTRMTANTEAEKTLTPEEVPLSEEYPKEETLLQMEQELPEGERLNEEDSDFFIEDGNRPQEISYAKNLLHTSPKTKLDYTAYYDTEKLLEDFYTIDASTKLQEALSVEKMLQKDLTLELKSDAPQILIYHTHSQEGYINSFPGSMDSSVVGAGEILATILREEYGYQVLHYKEQFDVQARDYAYSYALPAIEQILKDTPSIEVVIDLHRDAVAEDRKLITNIDGYDMAQIMFFNGLSYHKDIGQIAYLPNPYLEDNLAFSFQMQMACESYYPGLARKIYLKGYRYNMHVKPRTLLIELGAQTNTFQEAVSSLAPLARCLHVVLSGKLDKEI